MKPRTTPTCRKCHRTRVARQGQTCPACQKAKRHTSTSRPFRGNAASVLAHNFPVASPAFFTDRYSTNDRCSTNDRRRRLFTTADLLQIHNPPLSLAEAGPDEFFTAAVLADAWTAFTNGQPFALNLGYGQ